MSSKFGVALLLVVATSIGCSKNDSNDNPNDQVNNPAENPGPSPTPTPEPTPGPRPVTWSRVSHQSFTDMIQPDQCDMPFRFRVDPKGRFRAGPCTTGGNDFKEGKLTQEERLDLEGRVAVLMKTDLTDESCEDGHTIVSSQTDLTLSIMKNYRVQLNGIDRTCHRGGKAQAQRLDEFMHQLSYQYYPKKSDFP